MVVARNDQQLYERFRELPQNALAEANCGLRILDLEGVCYDSR